MTESSSHDDCQQPEHIDASRREAIMSGFAITFLILTAFTIHHFKGSAELVGRGHIIGWLFVMLWLPIFMESIAGYWRRGDYSWSASWRLLLIWLIPPYRLVLSTYPGGKCVWLPVMGWQLADKNCFERLDRAFSIPMLFIAFMILPILAIELFWAKYVEFYPGLGLFLDLGTAMIWFAFTVEFIVMSAVAEKKLPYIIRHWLNLAIILLPFLAFMRGLQFVRLMRLGKLGRVLKVYRLRGLGLRAWQGMIALELIERVMLRSPQAKMQHYREQIMEKERQITLLKRRIDALRIQSEASDKSKEGPPSRQNNV